MHAVHGIRPYAGASGMPFAIVTAALALGLASPFAATAQPDPGQPMAAADQDGADPAVGGTDTEAPSDQTPPNQSPPDQTPPDQAPPDEPPPDQTPPDQAPPDQAPPDQAPPDEPPPDEPPTFLDSVTISATLRPAPVRDTPGVVSVIDGETIQERMVEDFADLVKYEPGVYVENNVTRLGLNGFNIRGIGGNRVMTLVDGVQTSEQFDFGPFNVHQAGLDVDILKTVEIVRSANSALYGSDALGGVVSLFTKDPADYLLDQRFYLGGKTTWDSRADAVGANLTLAAGGERVQASVFTSLDRGGAPGNQGVVDTRNHTRTAPNPQDVEGRQVLAKLVYSASPDNRWRAAAERYDSRVETDWLSNNRLLDFGRFAYLIEESAALDTQGRHRLSLDHTLADRGLDLLSWRVYGQRNDTAQVLDEARMTTGFGPPFSSTRHGTVDYEQVGYGGSAQGQHWLGGPDDGMLVTFGGSYKTDYFDMQRHRTETDTATGRPVPTDLIFPTKYFPESDVVEAGTYLQGEIRFGRLTLVPGVRYDHFSLDANQADAVFVASLNPEAADFSDGAVSPKIGLAARLTDVVTLHAQYAGGFRAPPYSAINTGFTSPREGYTTLPNPDLRAETSDNLEVGVRAGVRPREPRCQRVLQPLPRLHRADGPRRQPPDGAARVPEPEPRGGANRRHRGVRRGVPHRQPDGPGQLRADRGAGVPAGRRRRGADRAGDAARLRRAGRGGGRAALRAAGRPLGQRAVGAAGRGLPPAERGAVRPGGLPGRGPGGFRCPHRDPQAPPRPAQSDRRQVLRVVERAGASGQRSGHRPVLQPRGEPDHLARLRLVARGASSSRAARRNRAPGPSVQRPNLLSRYRSERNNAAVARIC